MAKETTDTIWLGTDLTRVFHIKDEAEAVSIDITGWALSWMLKRYTSDADASAILTKTTAAGAIVIAGTFNSDPDVNTQRATLTLTDDATAALYPGLYHWELKRTDDGYETVLAYGRMTLIQGVHR